MAYLPAGANFKRARILWEVGLHVAGNPDTPYGGNRDMCIVVGSGAGAEFKPWLRLSTGSAVMAHAVAKGDIEAAFVNPSAMLTQAYRASGCSPSRSRCASSPTIRAWTASSSVSNRAWVSNRCMT